MFGPAALRHPAFAWSIVAVLAFAVGVAAWRGASGQWVHALAWLGIAAVALGAFHARKSLPAFFGLLLALAAAVNGAGYTLNLWHQETAFDELVHAFTSFAGMAAIGWGLLRGHCASSRAVLFALVIGLGLALGLLWEGFEWLVGIIGSARDTWIDLAMDAIGAAVAAALTCWLHSREREY